jgi:hypothetical protein
MSAFAERLETEQKYVGIDVCTVRSVMGSALAAGKERLQGHLPKEYHSNTLTADKILQCLYVDGGAFIFSLCKSMTRSLNLIYHHFNRFGLDMHIGRGTSPSKTKCVIFLPPRFFNSHLPLAIANCNDGSDSNNNGNNSLTHVDQCKKQMARKKREYKETL